jgi:hypothetical protein
MVVLDSTASEKSCLYNNIFLHVGIEFYRKHAV